MQSATLLIQEEYKHIFTDDDNISAIIILDGNYSIVTRYYDNILSGNLTKLTLYQLLFRLFENEEIIECQRL